MDGEGSFGGGCVREELQVANMDLKAELLWCMVCKAPTTTQKNDICPAHSTVNDTSILDSTVCQPHFSSVTPGIYYVYIILYFISFLFLL